MPRLSFVPVALLVTLTAACEPLYEGPAPETAAGHGVQPPEPPETAPATASAPADGMYASAEVAVGEDRDTYDDNDPAALTDFRPALNAHGKWVDDSKYGTVWVPSTSEVGSDFVPYRTAGHWVYDDDWVWVSDYDWGWAPFHYGRWVVVGSGWAWVPGRVYRGAWVEWGWDPTYAYVGWYPMAPGFLWFGGMAVGYGFYMAPAWVYCPSAYVFSPAVATHVLAGPSVSPVAARVNGYVAATPGVGPSPTSLGYKASTIPHSAAAPTVAGSSPSSGSATGLARAQQFARPSTAAALGAHPPTPVASTYAPPASGRTAALPSATPAAMAAGARPGLTTAQPQVAGKKGPPPPDGTPQVRKPSTYTGHGYHPTAPAPASAPHGAPSGGHGGHR